MTLVRTCLFAVAITLTLSSQAAHADTFNFSVNGSAGGFTGSGVLTTTDSSGDHVITGLTGTGVTGLIAPDGFHRNDNLLFPDSNPALDASGFSFTDVNGPDHFNVNIFNDGTGYFAFLQDEDNFTATLPVTFELSNGNAPVPEPESLFLLGTGFLGAVTILRKRALSK